MRLVGCVKLARTAWGLLPPARVRFTHPTVRAGAAPPQKRAISASRLSASDVSCWCRAKSSAVRAAARASGNRPISASAAASDRNTSGDLPLASFSARPASSSASCAVAEPRIRTRRQQAGQRRSGPPRSRDQPGAWPSIPRSPPGTRRRQLGSRQVRPGRQVSGRDRDRLPVLRFGRLPLALTGEQASLFHMRRTNRGSSASARRKWVLASTSRFLAAKTTARLHSAAALFGFSRAAH